MHPYAEHVNPYLAELLNQVGLDKRFIKGQECLLWDDQGHQYLDLIAAYGALPFGFNYPAIWEAVDSVKTSGEPSFVQPSYLDAAGELAQRLSAAAPGDLNRVIYANSGAEAVEAAIKLCRSVTGRCGILSTHNSFHGKTLGALSATGNPDYHKGFGAPSEGFCHIPFGDAAALRQVMEESASELAAFIVEPIQGEGGIILPPPGYLRQAVAICREFGVPIVFDEIQTGLGRTGTLFACEEEEAVPDVLVLAKALGGGLFPIGAIITHAQMFSEKFGLKHSSTFAGNTLACRIGLKVLDLLQADGGQLLKDITAKGAYLRQGLERIQRKYPQVIHAIRGRGLMLGIDFDPSDDYYSGTLLQVMVDQELLAPVVASYMLNRERLRVAPTLNGKSVIRIEPPLIISEHQLAQALAGIERTVAVLARRDTAGLIRHLLNPDSPAQESTPTGMPAAKVVPVKRKQPLPSGDPEEGRFAFLIHPIDVRNYSDFDQSLQTFSRSELNTLAERWNTMLDPFYVGSTVIESPTGQRAFGDFIGVPRTADHLLAMNPAEVQAELTHAIDLAVERGAKLVGLGAYTSVVTMGGRALAGKVAVPLTTGNSYTVVTGVEALLNGASRLGLDLSHSTAAVIGGGGAIGKASAMLLAEQTAELILISNPARPEKSLYRLTRVTAEIFRFLTQQSAAGHHFAANTLGRYSASLPDLPDPHGPLTPWIALAKEQLTKGCPIQVTLDAAETLPRAHMILAATSSTETMIHADMLREGALVCDMSRPANVDPNVRQVRPDVLVIDGGVIAVPKRPPLGVELGFEQGLAYACMSETMILALEHRYENTSIGADLNIHQLKEIQALAQKHGFELAALRNADETISEAVFDEVRLQQHYQSTGC